jgi:hypothetical protein
MSRRGHPFLRRRSVRAASGGGDGLPTLAYDWRAGAGVADDGTGPPPGVDSWTDQIAGVVVTQGDRPDLIAADADFGGEASIDFGVTATAGLRDSAPRASFGVLHDGTGMTVAVDLLIESGASGNGTIIDTNNSSASLLGVLFRYQSAGSVIRCIVGNGSANVIDFTGAVTTGTRHRVMWRFASTAFDSDGAGLMRVSDLWVDGTQVASVASVSNAAASGTPADKLGVGNRATSVNGKLDGRIRRLSIAPSVITLDEWDAWRAVA